MSLTDAQLTGRDESHLHYRGSIALMPACWQAFEELRSAAAQAGFELCIASGFRSFERQLAIWNAKASGQRPVHDDRGLVVAMSALSPLQQVRAIMRYSALPGASRHHWGSDLDIYDAGALPEGYQLQLTPQEVADDGMFGALHYWLDEQIAADTAAGFFRPYATDMGGVAPERWHLSYAPLAQQCAAQLTPDCLRDALATGELVYTELVLSELAALYERYVAV